MRPINLSVDGFTSYGEATDIYLDPVTLAVITGSNGAGKTSLVDAMVWALFGRGRVDGDIDAIVSTGKPQAQVAFEFELDGRVWRVARTRVRGKRTSALLECQDESGMWQARSNGSVRDTDDAVRRVLGMSVETFLATVIVGQGDADRFCAAEPAARKEVLGEVLGLGRYQKWAEAARSHLNDVRVELRSAESRHETILSEIEALPQAQADLAGAEDAQRVAQDEVAAGERALRSAQEAATEASGTVEALSQAEAAVVAAELARRVALDAEAGRVRAAESRLTQAKNRLERCEADLAAARAADAACQAFRDEANQLASELADATSKEEAVLEAGQAAKAAQVDLEGQLVRARENHQALGKREAGVKDAIATGGGDCWVCDQPLTPEHAQEMLSAIQQEIVESVAAGTRLKEEVAAATATTDGLKAEYQQARSLREMLNGQITAATANAEREQAKGAQGPELEARVSEAAAEVHAAETDLEGCRAGLSAAEADTTATDAQAEVERLRELVGEQGGVLQALSQAEAVVRAAYTRLLEAGRQVGSLNERVDALVRAQESAGVIADQARELRCSEADWGLTAKAFGRDGIPTLLINAAVPELQDQANKILGDLSGGNLQVALNTTRVTKSGTTKETLDIAVLGPDGERPYDSYSGGERLRIDIAIRLGLSQILANRSGTQIRTLIIDEGWGPLDNEGVPALIDCLRVLQESGRFAAVYTVTHIPDVADAFPQRIVVERGVDGFSTVDLVA